PADGSGRPRARRAGLHVQRAARGNRGRRFASRLRGRRRAADAGPWLAAPPGRPDPLLLEERKVAPRARAPLHRRTGLLGALRLPQRRGLLEGGAVRVLGASLERGTQAGARPRRCYERPTSPTLSS